MESAGENTAGVTRPSSKPNNPNDPLKGGGFSVIS